MRFISAGPSLSKDSSFCSAVMSRPRGSTVLWGTSISAVTPKCSTGSSKKSVGRRSCGYIWAILVGRRSSSTTSFVVAIGRSCARTRSRCSERSPRRCGMSSRRVRGSSRVLPHLPVLHYEAHAPLKRNVLPEELGATGTFLASDGAAAITGQVLYVDCGYQVMGM